MINEAIQTLYRYNTWANARILDTAEQLIPEQFLMGRGMSFDSLRDTLVHTMSALWLWLERWNGRSPTAAALDGRAFSELASIRTRWVGIEQDTQALRALGITLPPPTLLLANRRIEREARLFQDAQWCGRADRRKMSPR